MSDDIKIGNIYRTETDHLKQVIGIETDSDGTVRISWSGKSAKIPGRAFQLGHTKATPPSDETFKSNSGRLLTKAEIQELINEGILSKDELINQS